MVPEATGRDPEVVPLLVVGQEPPLLAEGRGDPRELRGEGADERRPGHEGVDTHQEESRGLLSIGPSGTRTQMGPLNPARWYQRSGVVYAYVVV